MFVVFSNRKEKKKLNKYTTQCNANMGTDINFNELNIFWVTNLTCAKRLTDNIPSERYKN